MSIVTENYIGYDALVSYLSESKNLSYCRFLSLNRNTIIASLTQITSSSLTPTKWQSFNIAWNNRFLVKAKELLDTNTFVELKKKVRLLLFCKVWVTPNTRRGHLVRITVLTTLVSTEHLRYIKYLQIFWQEVIKECDKEFEKENQVLAETPQLDLSKNNQEYEKENLLPTETSLIKECDKEYEEIQVLVETSQLNAVKVTVTEASLLPKRIVKISAKNHSEVDLSKKNVELINFCYDILHELENETNANLFYKYVKKDVKNMGIKYPMDLFTINSKLKNNQYTSLEEFEKDIRLIFRNCYTYNNVESEVYCSGEILESIFNKKWSEKLIFQDKQTRELKRLRDSDADDDTDRSWKKQSQILEQNKNNLMYRQVINDALLVTSAYESLIIGDITPFIEILKSFLLTRSQMSLSSANEAMLQAIVEILLPLKYRIPELSLVMDGKKSKGSGRFGYSDIFVLKGTGNNYISLELKYISLVGLIRLNQKVEFGANELENLDKILEKENEEILLKRPYAYWSKELKKTNQTTIGEVLDNGIRQLESYMNTIAKGKVADYFSSGIFDKRVKIVKSNPNKLKGFVILVIGFRRILWKPVEEVISNYTYNKI
ncbi:uncharacterized protein OCT59_008356 [Rhizophagus irregularis]|nr:hypothetical protein OCT59_008356 [Rhizophagus irregularis]GBC27847.2 hypothetical protein GLOIN_2v1781474 [Rhizophagus irregularis DAOM 181602=DAOM 197198]